MMVFTHGKVGFPIRESIRVIHFIKGAEGSIKGEKKESVSVLAITDEGACLMSLLMGSIKKNRK